MAIEKNELEEEETTTETAEEKAERLQAERESAEEARKAELESARADKHKAEIEAATAKGEAEALKRGITAQPAQQGWDDNRWEEEAQKRGMSGPQFKQLMADAAGISNFHSESAKKEAEEARKEAREAKEELKRIKTGKSLDSVESSFYKKNPALEAHKKLVDEFINSYPDADSIDPATLEKRLVFAVDIVKGKVKENMRTRKPSETGSGRFEGAEERHTNEDEDNFEFDPRGAGNGAALMASVHANFGRDVKHEDSLEVWKKCKDDEGRGVSISMDEDKARAKRLMGQESLGGRKGAK